MSRNMKVSHIRGLWLQAEWGDLGEIQIGEISDLDGRADIALMVSAAHFHQGDRLSTQLWVRQAIGWGASEEDVLRILNSGVSNTMGRLLLLLEKFEGSSRLFEASVATWHGGVDAESDGLTRQFHEMLNFGLLPEAAEKLTGLCKREARGSWASNSRVKILESKVELMNHELSIALQRGNLGEKDEGIRLEFDPKIFAKENSVSQLGQDIWILESTNYKREGFFVEFGATNGILLSNSYLLEVGFDWRGVCAEPNPEFFKELQKNRKCVVSPECISGETGREVEFVAAREFGGFSEYADSDMHEETRQAYREQGYVMNLKTISLHDFLLKHQAPRTIDYLSIDTEGSEYEILSSFPFEKWDIRHLTVEHNFTEAREKIFELLSSKGYERIEADWDDWYRKPA